MQRSNKNRNTPGISRGETMKIKLYLIGAALLAAMGYPRGAAPSRTCLSSGGWTGTR